MCWNAGSAGDEVCWRRRAALRARRTERVTPRLKAELPSSCACTRATAAAGPCVPAQGRARRRDARSAAFPLRPPACATNKPRLPSLPTRHSVRSPTHPITHPHAPPPAATHAPRTTGARLIADAKRPSPPSVPSSSSKRRRGDHMVGGWCAGGALQGARVPRPIADGPLPRPSLAAGGRQPALPHAAPRRAARGAGDAQGRGGAQPPSGAHPEGGARRGRG